MSIPTYKKQGKTRKADSCQPVIEAIKASTLRHVALARGQYPGKRIARNALPGLRAISCWDTTQQQDWGLDWHCNEGIELSFVESGMQDFVIKTDKIRKYRLKAGDLTVARPWQKHRVGNPCVDIGRIHFLILDVGVRQPHQTWRWPAWIVLGSDDLRQLTNILRHNELPVWHAGFEIADCFRQISKAIEADQNGSSTSILAININRLFLSILEMFRTQKVILDESLSLALRTVELFWLELRENQDVLSLEWTVRDMAQQCGMGVTKFIYHTKQLINMTPFQYLNYCRLTTAAKLLKEKPDLSITEIALSSGFASSQYFATLFRRRFGDSPRTFRNCQ